MTDDDIAKARAKIADGKANTDSSWAVDNCNVLLRGWSAALDEVERLTKLHAEKHAQNERMCAEIERLDGEVSWLDRVALIASAAFGPFPVRSAEDNLTAIEHGIGKLHGEIERLRAEVERQTKLHDLAERAMRSANEASKGFEALAQAAHDRKESLEVVADAARALVAEHDACYEPSPFQDEIRALKRARRRSGGLVTKPLATTSAETAARYHVAKHHGPRSIAPPAYVTDGIAIPRRKRRVLLDLAPATADFILESIRRSRGYLRTLGFTAGEAQAMQLERVLVEALEKAR